MKKYSKSVTFIAIVALMFALALQSCENTYTKENSKIEKCLSKRDFDKAREIAQSIAPEDYYYSSDDHKRHYYRQEAMLKINQAQLSIMTADGQWDDAQAFAQELNATDAFQELFRNNINKLLKSRQYETILLILSSWQIEKPYRERVENSNYTEKGDIHEEIGNVPFNEEVQAYNKMVDGILQYAILNDELGLTKKCIALYKPEAVLVKKEKKYPNSETYTLKNNAKTRALEILKENGITLK